MEVIRLIRAALTTKKTKARRAMEPSIDPTARRTPCVSSYPIFVVLIQMVEYIYFNL